MKTEGIIMKSISRSIQIVAIIVFLLIWIGAGNVKHLDFDSLAMVGAIGVFFLARWLIGKIIPQTTARCRFFQKLVWVFILLTLIFTVLSCIKFNDSTLTAVVETLIFFVFMWLTTWTEQQRLEEQLIKEQKLKNGKIEQ